MSSSTNCFQTLARGLFALEFAFAATSCGQLRSEGIDFDLALKPVLVRYCVECHSGDAPSGDMDLAAMLQDSDRTHRFEQWSKAAELVGSLKMPPMDEPQPSSKERELIQSWYQLELAGSIEPRPGPLLPRRLSAPEYRNTLRSLLGFDLETAIIEAEQTRIEKSLVLKLLPKDPPGKSGFRNDTHGNPLTTQVWELYSYLADSVLEELFSGSRENELAALAGPRKVGELTWENAETLVRTFVPRAFRRTPDESLIDAILDRLDENRHRLQDALKVELKVILMSPRFLYRGLLVDAEPGQQPVDDYELAERLSYFLWADMPDGELQQLAREGTLQEPEILDAQILRMLDSPKARSLAEDFGTQWLGLDNIDDVSDNEPHTVALKSQPIDFLHYLNVENRPLMEIIDSNVTFANPLTKKFYPQDAPQFSGYRKPKGIEIEIVPNQKIALENSIERGGLLTMPGILAMNRGPIIRGTWMLERILGEQLPDPPANVGQVPENLPGEKLTFRQRFEQHRRNPTCALCHDKIDPLGFALAAYDDDGNFRPREHSEQGKRNSKKDAAQDSLGAGAVDTSGLLPSGERFGDFQELKQILATTQRERVLRNLVRRMLSYAICRSLDYYDQPTVDAIVDRLNSPESSYRDLVFEIAQSLPFREMVIPERPSE